MVREDISQSKSGDERQGIESDLNTAQQRTHMCGSLREEHIGERVCVMGWVHSVRDFGRMMFLDVRDREGVVQVVFRENDTDPLIHISLESVIAVEGVVQEREQHNPHRATGKVEISARGWTLLSKAEKVPFLPSDVDLPHEETRLAHRHLDLRRLPLLNQLRKRHTATHSIRNFLHERGFLEVETPILARPTPEGARDYVVPSRVHQGQFYALPQSPQLFKQLLMCGGVDRYMQIARCFRDEDLRADRQPEFTQIDLEMSFSSTAQLMELCEEMMQRIYGNLPTPFPKMAYQEAMSRFGTDRPDLRWGMELREAKNIAPDFPPFQGKSEIYAIAVPGGAQWSRKEIERWMEHGRSQCGLEVITWIKRHQGEWSSSVMKLVDRPALDLFADEVSCNEGDLLFLVAGSLPSLGKLRVDIAKEAVPPSPGYHFLWIVDFPLFEWTEGVESGQGRWYSVHHPFVAPHSKTPHHSEWEHLSHGELGSMLSTGYDLVCNGFELGGGSHRIHQLDQQLKALSVLGISPQKAEEQFGYLLRAMKHGIPPHQGIAFGLERMLMLDGDAESIRDVIAFPKTHTGRDAFFDSPTCLRRQDLLGDLGITLSAKG